MAKCARCLEGPKGIEGHTDLFVSTMSGSTMQFVCRKCQAMWVRRRGPERPEWSDATGQEMGATLPCRAEG